MTNPKVSVTVPIYNSSKYLKQCLDSLSAQTLKEIEFILVDDGSTDDSGTICDQYASKDSRFKVIHKRNGGSASARQAGLEASSGDYIIVCDSDDWVEHNIYEMLYNKVVETDADIVRCDYISEYIDGRSVENKVSFKIQNNGIIDNIDYSYKGAGASFVQLIRRFLFTQNSIFYESGINLGEDSLITLKLMKCNPKVVKLDKCLYHYRRQYGEDSYTNRITNDKIQQLYRKYWWIKENYDSSEYGRMRLEYAQNIVFATLRSIGAINKEQLRKFLYVELPLKQILKQPYSLKSIIVMLCKLLPIDFVRRVVNLLYPLFYR